MALSFLTKPKNQFAPDINAKVIGLFAGCGGLDLGFKQAGFKIVYANDSDPGVKETYEFNLGPIEINDISLVDKSKLPDCDILLAGIPCQPFSNAGNRKSTNDHRGSVFSEVMFVLRVKKPKVVVFENVRGFLSSKDDHGELMPIRLTKELSKLKYKTFYKLMNAADYEVPQNRHRVFIIGIREDIECNYQFPEPIESIHELNVGSVLKKPLPKDEPVEIWDLSPQSKEMAKYIPAGGSWKDIPDKKLPDRLKKIRNNMKFYHSPNFYRRFDSHEIMGTITAAGTPENSGILHPFEDRRYSVREIARFQSFPDSFKFLGTSIPKKYKMIGNAVPVRLAFHIALSIREQIDFSE
jgi:DNA (cytosine-5)-methyltransferase 1